MIRVGLAFVLLLLSLLVLIKAPTNFLWRAAVAVTEFPYIFIFTSVLLLVSSVWALKYRVPVVAITAVAAFIFMLPLIRTYSRTSDLREELSLVFPFHENDQLLKQPFRFFSMFTGIGVNDVAYKTYMYKKELTLDYYVIRGKQKAPCVVIIHGGSWAEGDSQQLPALNSYLSNKGYNVAAINYRLAPDFKFPAPVEDTRDAIHYLTEHAAELNIDTTSFVLLGRSAGGQIALMAAYTLHNKNIKGVISYYAPADMEWGARIKTNKWVLDTDKVLGDYIGGSVNDVPEKYKASSAPEFVTPQTTPTLLIHGPNDALVSYEHSVRLKKKLDENHVKNYFLNLPTATHGCDYNINGPSGQACTYTVERFLSSVISN